MNKNIVQQIVGRFLVISALTFVMLPTLTMANGPISNSPAINGNNASNAPLPSSGDGTNQTPTATNIPSANVTPGGVNPLVWWGVGGVAVVIAGYFLFKKKS